jgi:hypothetical protein
MAGGSDTNDAFFTELRSLIDAWCERRSLKALAAVLPSYVAINGMTDGWGELHVALRSIGTLHRDLLTPSEQAAIDRLARAAADIVSRPLGPG